MGSALATHSHFARLGSSLSSFASVPSTEGNEGNQGSCSLFFVHLSPTESHWFLSPLFASFTSFAVVPPTSKRARTSRFAAFAFLRGLLLKTRRGSPKRDRQQKLAKDRKVGPTPPGLCCIPKPRTTNPFTHPHPHPLPSDFCPLAHSRHELVGHTHAGHRLKICQASARTSDNVWRSSTNDSNSSRSHSVRSPLLLRSIRCCSRSSALGGKTEVPNGLDPFCRRSHHRISTVLRPT